MKITDNINVKNTQKILSPEILKKEILISENNMVNIFNYRNIIENILNNNDERKFIVVGPCSIHDYDMAIDYAKKLKILADQVSDKLFIVMRVYFEKPRTTIGWKGLINDPNLNDTFEIELGLKLARKIMKDITDIGLAIGTEALDPISPQYLSDFISWGAIGARTTESQTHREMASGLSYPIGFKNGTDGNIDIAINALLSSSNPHSFLGINNAGEVSIINTSGNKFGHIILRGGNSGPNYNSVSLFEIIKEIKKHKISPKIVIDCSHGNSYKNHKLQSMVFEDVINQIIAGNESIKGLMLESNIYEGNQKLITGEKEKLNYGVSITDACIGWEETEELIKKTYIKLKNKS